ncbi:MAG: hypothetical protein V7752_21860, partial [Halopseudomonas sp.]
ADKLMESTIHYKKRYMKAFEQRLVAFYEKCKNVGQVSEQAQRDIEIFIEAGIVSGLTDKEELQPIIENHHWAVFKKTLEQGRKDRVLNDAAEGDYSKLDQPTWERQGIKI